MPAAFASEVGLAPRAVSAESAHTVLKWLKARPDSAWAQVTPRSKDRTRIKFGRRGFYGTDEGWFAQIPPDLLAIGQEALEAARARFPDAPWEAFGAIDTVVVNRYAAGRGVNKHKDPPRWVPLVLGVTLCDDPYGPVSVMQFEQGQERVQVATPHLSAYVFHGRAYTDATHARKPGHTKQRGLVYSLTFRSHA